MTDEFPPDRVVVEPRPKMRNPQSNHGFGDFPVGTRVRVVCTHQDMIFFSPGGRDGPTGEVVRNGGRYLSIIVRWDKPRLYHDNSSWCDARPCSNPAHAVEQKEFGFNPTDLLIEGEVEAALHDEVPKLFGRT